MYPHASLTDCTILLDSVSRHPFLSKIAFGRFSICLSVLAQS